MLRGRGSAEAAVPLGKGRRAVPLFCNCVEYEYEIMMGMVYGGAVRYFAWRDAPTRINGDDW